MRKPKKPDTNNTANCRKYEIMISGWIVGFSVWLAGFSSLGMFF